MQGLPQQRGNPAGVDPAVMDRIFPVGTERECMQSVFDSIALAGSAGVALSVTAASFVGAGPLTLAITLGICTAGYVGAAVAEYRSTPVQERSVTHYVPSLFKGRAARALAGAVSAFCDPGPGGRVERSVRMAARTVCVAAPWALGAWLWAPSALGLCVGAAAVAGVLGQVRACFGAAAAPVPANVAQPGADEVPAPVADQGQNPGHGPVEDVNPDLEDEPALDDDQAPEDEPVQAVAPGAVQQQGDRPADYYNGVDD